MFLHPRRFLNCSSFAASHPWGLSTLHLLPLFSVALPAPVHITFPSRAVCPAFLWLVPALHSLVLFHVDAGEQLPKERPQMHHLHHRPITFIVNPDRCKALEAQPHETLSTRSKRLTSPPRSPLHQISWKNLLLLDRKKQIQKSKGNRRSGEESRTKSQKSPNERLATLSPQPLSVI